jgi:hypothetical protein
MMDWESTNDDSDPHTFNWDYYEPIYSGRVSYDTQQAGSNFADTWDVIDYLHQKGIPDSGIVLSFMGPGPSWMGGSFLDPDQEDEFVESVLSAAYYGYSHGHTFGLFSPNNEMDIEYNEGVTMTDTRNADVMDRLARRMDALDMGGVKLLGPETCCNVRYADAMRSRPALMARLAAFDFHNYAGDDNGAADAVAGTGKDFWISEYTHWNHTFTYLDQGAAGLLLWEAYDSVYNHAVLNGRGTEPGNDSLTFGDIPLLAYDENTRVYTPREEFFHFGQLFKWVPIGAQRIHAESGDGNVKIEAFADPATQRLTLVGHNFSDGDRTLSIALANVPATGPLQYHQTNSDSHMARGADVPVLGDAATVTVPADTTFTLTGTGEPDAVPPSEPRDLSATGDTGSVSLSWSAPAGHDDVTRYTVHRSTTSGFTPGDATEVGRSSTTSFKDTDLAAGTYYYVVSAVDAAGNTSPPSNEASVAVTAGPTAADVWITTPTDGATVAGTVDVTAAVSGNEVTGVQLRLDGVDMGPEVATVPFTTTWDTTKAGDGEHRLIAVARDGAGRTTTSAAVTVTVSNTVAITPLLGLDSIQDFADSDAAGEAEAFRFLAGGSGRAGTVTLYVDSGSRATTLDVGVYDDAGGDPGTLLASGRLDEIRPGAWNTMDLGSAATLSSGTPYWIAVLGRGGRIDFRAGPTGQCSQSHAVTDLTELPRTWSPGGSWPTCGMSAYVSATTGPAAAGQAP